VAGIEVGIIPIFESTAERGLQGAAAGTEDAGSILRYMASCGQPSATAYILTFDFDEQTAQDPACRAYAAAAVAGVPNNPMIAYGNGALTEELKTAGIAKLAWDAGGSGMRGTRVDLAAGAENMEQDVGDVRDLNLGISIDSDFAPHANSPADLDAWCSPGATAISPAPQPASPEPVITIPTAAQLQAALGITVDSDWGPRSQAALAAYYASHR
jgi:hypothetical protein